MNLSPKLQCDNANLIFIMSICNALLTYKCIYGVGGVKCKMRIMDCFFISIE